MTREEAIDRLKEARVGHYEFLSMETLNMAIKALKQEPCEDAISRQATVEFLENHAETYEDVRVKMGFKASASLINNRNNLPSVNPQPKTGHWIRQDNTKEPLYGWYFCSECNSVIGDKTKFCSNCGAKLVEPQERSDKE